MKISSDRTSGSLSTQTAWGCLATNLAMPGFGSVLGGRRVTGYAQAALAIGGMVLTVTFGARFIVWYIENWSALVGADVEDPIDSLLQMWSAVRWALVGIALFVIAWFWSLLTSIALLRNAKADKPPPLAR